MRNFIKAELYVSLKNKAYRILFAIVAALILLLNILLMVSATKGVTSAELFRTRIQGFSFMFIFGIMGMAIVSAISMGDLSKGGAVKNVISSGLERWKYVVGKVFVTTLVLIVYLVLFLVIHLGFSAIVDGIQAFRENLPMIQELLTTLLRACFFWMVWMTVLVAFEFLLPNVGVGALIGTILTGNFTTILVFFGMKIQVLREPIEYIAMRLPSTMMQMFYSAYIKTTTEAIFGVPVPSVDVYLVSGVLAIIMTAIGILAFRRREL